MLWDCMSGAKDWERFWTNRKQETAEREQRAEIEQKRSCYMSHLVVPGESEKTSGLRAGALLPGEAVQTFDFCLAVTVSCIQMSHCCRK